MCLPELFFVPNGTFYFKNSFEKNSGSSEKKMEERWQDGVLATSRRAQIDAQGILIQQREQDRAHALHSAVCVPTNMLCIETYMQKACNVLEGGRAQSARLEEQFATGIADQLSDALIQCYRSISPHPWLQPAECLKHWHSVCCVIACCVEWKHVSTAPSALVNNAKLQQQMHFLEKAIWTFLKHVRFVKMPMANVDKRPHDLNLPALNNLKPKSGEYELPRSIRRVVWQCLCNIQYWKQELAPSLSESTLSSILESRDALDVPLPPLNPDKCTPFQHYSPQLDQYTNPDLHHVPRAILPLRFAQRPLSQCGISDISSLLYAYSEQWYCTIGTDHRVIKALWMRLCECMVRDDIVMVDPFLIVDGEPTEYFYLEMERHLVRHILLRRAMDDWIHLARRTQAVSQVLARGSVPEGIWCSHAMPDLPAALHLPPRFKSEFCGLMQRLSMCSNWYSILRDKVRNLIMDTALLPHEIEKQHDVSPSLAPKAKIVIHAARPKHFEYIAEVALDDRCLDRILSLSHGDRMDLEDASLSDRDATTGMIMPVASLAGASPEILELRRAFARRALPTVIQQIIGLVDPQNIDLMPRVHVGEGDACTMALSDVMRSPDDVSPHIIECRGEYAIVMRPQGIQGALMFQTTCFIHALYVWHAAWAWRFGTRPRGSLFIAPFAAIMDMMIQRAAECTALHEEL